MRGSHGAVGTSVREFCKIARVCVWIYGDTSHFGFRGSLGSEKPLSARLSRSMTGSYALRFRLFAGAPEQQQQGSAACTHLAQ